MRPLRAFGTVVALAGLLAAAVFVIDAKEAPAADRKALATPSLVGQQTSGRLAPDFTAETIEGGSFRLSAYRGRVVVLDFLLPACIECEFEAPRLERAAARFPRGVKVVIVDVSGAPRKLLRDYYRASLRLQKVTVVRDLPSRFKIASSYRVIGLGMTFVVGRDGRISWQGFWTGKESRLLAAISAALR